MKNLWISMLALFIIWSCNPSAQIMSEEKQAYPIKIINDKPHILSAIITFKGQKDKFKIDSYNLVLSESKLKEGSLIKQEQANYLKCEFTDNEGIALHTQWIENPLLQRVEGVDKNGDLITVQNLREEGTGLVRVNFNNNMTQLNIYDKKENQYLLIGSIELKDEKK